MNEISCCVPFVWGVFTCIPSPSTVPLPTVLSPALGIQKTLSI